MSDDAKMKKIKKDIRKPAKEGRIVFAEQDRISLIPHVLLDEFLEKVFGVDGALVTDESKLSDFVSFASDLREAEREAACVRIFELYGVACRPDDYLWEVLRAPNKMKNQSYTQRYLHGPQGGPGCRESCWMIDYGL